MTARSRFGCVLVTIGLCGCAVGPTYHKPSVDEPPAFKSERVAAPVAAVSPDWWRLFRDDRLDQLIVRADAANQTIKQAAAAVDQARALVRVASSFRYPSISLGVSVTRQRTSAERVSTISGQKVAAGATFNDHLVAADLSYEVDVWGRVRRSVEAQRALATGASYDEAVVRLGVQTEVAQDYYALRGFDAQAAILADTVASYREQVRILNVQVSTGLSSPIPLQQAEALLQATLSQQADVLRARADLEHALAVLCGASAPRFSVAPDPLREVAPPVVPAGLPAEVLRQRPDIASAEQQVVAANAQVGVATANLYPTLALTGSAGYESGLLSNLLDWQGRLWSIAAGLTAPIFQGGRLRANLDATRAQYRQVVATYTNQVLGAYADVEDALTDLHALSNEAASLRLAVFASQEYLRVAQVQFRNGLVDYLTVVDAERTLLSNQLALSQVKTNQMAASVHLIKALGGGWERV